MKLLGYPGYQGLMGLGDIRNKFLPSGIEGLRVCTQQRGNRGCGEMRGSGGYWGYQGAGRVWGASIGFGETGRWN